MNRLVDTQTLTAWDLRAIFSRVNRESAEKRSGWAVCSFQGSGTRTTFVQAAIIELPLDA